MYIYTIASKLRKKRVIIKKMINKWQTCRKYTDIKCIYCMLVSIYTPNICI
jgi:hypothetical protein